MKTEIPERAGNSMATASAGHPDDVESSGGRTPQSPTDPGCWAMSRRFYFGKYKQCKTFEPEASLKPVCHWHRFNRE